MSKTLKPQIRFKGYDDEWSEFHLSDLGPVKMCKRILKHQTTEKGDVPFFKIGTFGRCPDAYISKELFEEFQKLYPFPKTGDVLISAAGTIGRSVVYDGTPAYYQDSNIIWIDNDNKLVNNDFLSVILPTIKWAVSSTTIARIYNDTVRATASQAPKSLEEQHDLGKFFNRLDTQIKEAEREVDRLEKMKIASLQKMFPRPGATAPEIRFAGFSEPWETMTFKDLYSSLKNNTLSRDCLNYNGGIAKNIHYGDVLIKFGAYVNPLSVDVPFVNFNVSIELSSAYKLADGDVIFADTAEDEAVGKCTEIRGVRDSNVVSGLHTIAVRPNFKFAPYYLGYYHNANAYHSQLLPLMQGVKVLSINRTAISETMVAFPSSLNEQRAIGEYFRNLDELIAAKRKSIVKLRNIKKACLSKMFVNDTEL